MVQNPGQTISYTPFLMFGGNIMRHLWKPALFAVMLSTPLLFAEETPPKADEPVNTSTDNSVKPDNSRRNQRERAEQEKTPINQNENKADLEISRKIRQSILDDKNLSTYAHNIKIITQDGIVNLKGPVRSQEEKRNVEARAVDIAGRDKVKSQIEVAP